MTTKAFFAFLAQALLIQAAFAQYNSVRNVDVDINNAYSNVNGYGNNVNLAAGVNQGSGLLLNNDLALAGGLGLGTGLGLGSGLGLSLGGNSLLGNNVLINSGVSSGLGLGLNSGLGSGGAVLASPGFVDLVSISAGGVLPVSSVGPVVPAGLTVVSDNAIEGAVLVSGQLPFLSAATFEGPLLSGGSGAASCGCGNGAVGIISESTPSVVSGLGLGAGIGGLGAGLGNGLVGLGAGLGGLGGGLGGLGAGIGSVAGLNAIGGLSSLGLNNLYI